MIYMYMYMYMHVYPHQRTKLLMLNALSHSLSLPPSSLLPSTACFHSCSPKWSHRLCLLPLPYIIDINPSCIKQIETMETMEEALIVDLEKKKFIRKVHENKLLQCSWKFLCLENFSFFHSLVSWVKFLSCKNCFSR